MPLRDISNKQYRDDLIDYLEALKVEINNKIINFIIVDDYSQTRAKGFMECKDQVIRLVDQRLWELRELEKMEVKSGNSNTNK